MRGLKRSQATTTSFSLPILLSFNEMAWIVIFGMVLVCIYAFREIDDVPKLQTIISQQQNQILNLQSPYDEAAAANRQLNTQVTSMASNISDWSNRWRLKGLDLAAAQTSNTALIALLDRRSKEAEHFSNLWMIEMTAGASLRNVNSTLTQRLNYINSELESNRAGWADARRSNDDFQRRFAAFSNVVRPDTPSSGASLANPPNRNMESVIRQELLGLKGGLPDQTLSNVVILLDRSESMKTANRWPEAINVVNTWLTYLPLSRCVLLTFSDGCEPVLTNGWLELSGQQGAINRRRLVQELTKLQPYGATDTCLAFTNAFRYECVDTIILFSDGKPERSRGDVKISSVKPTSGMMMDAVLNYCTNRCPRIPVNTIGLGEYFDKEQGMFLRKLAVATGGTFIGR